MRNTVALPCRVVEEANRAPRLPDRLATTLHLVLAGCSNPSIARQLHQSESTVKRDINTLLRRFSAPNRLALVGVARSAGYGTPDRVAAGQGDGGFSRSSTRRASHRRSSAPSE